MPNKGLNHKWCAHKQLPARPHDPPVDGIHVVGMKHTVEVEKEGGGHGLFLAVHCANTLVRCFDERERVVNSGTRLCGCLVYCFNQFLVAPCMFA